MRRRVQWGSLRELPEGLHLAEGAVRVCTRSDCDLWRWCAQRPRGRCGLWRQLPKHVHLIGRERVIPQALRVGEWQEIV